MKILFVYPTKLNTLRKPIKYRKAFLPPLALAILDGLTPDKHDVRIIDNNIE